MCDIVCTAVDIASTLSHHTTVFMMSHPLQAWRHTPCIRHWTHCNFVITTSPLISHPLLNDILPTFWVTSYELYVTTHQSYVITLLHLWHHSLYVWNHIQYEGQHTLNMWHHSHYLCHHTQCIDNITPTLFMTSNSPYVWHHLHYTRHHILTFWPQTTILRTSHPVY